MQRKPAGRVTIEGAIDRVEAGRIEGWVLNPAAPKRRAIVEARAGEWCLAVAQADQFRQALLDQGISDGRCGFTLDLPETLGTTDPVEVTVCLANTDLVIPGSPVLVAGGRRPRPRVIGSVDVVNGLTILGWVADPLDRTKFLTVRLREGDRVVATSVANQFRGDLAEHGIGYHAFEIKLPLALADGAKHCVHVETEDGPAVPGSPVTCVGLPGGARSLLPILAGPADRTAQSRAAAVLDVHFLQADRDAPTSLAFDDYPAWFEYFMAADAQLAPEQTRHFVVIVDVAADLEAGLKTLQGLGAAGCAGAGLAVGVDPDAWNNADERMRAAFVRLAGDQPADRATLTPCDVLAGLPADRFVLWLEPGACLAPGGLAALARAIDGGADVIYADWESEEAGQRTPQLLPDWNHHYLLSTDYLGPFLAFRAGLAPVPPEEEWADARLRALEAARPGGIRHVPRIVGAGRRSLTRALPRATLQRHMGRAGLQARVRSHPVLSEAWALDFMPPQPLPLVSLIIPTRDRVELVRDCVSSVLARTAYPALEVIIVDNGSSDPETLRFLTEVARWDRVTVLRDARPFNYSALNNAAAATARGAIVGLLNNDIVVPTDCDPYWLHRVVGRLGAPGVGAVGIKLIYASGLVQHAGVVVGIGGMAENAFKHLRVAEPGYAGRAVLAQEVSAVTGAALFLRRESFETVGGLDADFLPVAFNDVDLCLKLAERGQRIVLDPEVVFFHLESASRGRSTTPEAAARDVRERTAFQERWRQVIAADPHYNVNLNLDGLPYRGLALPPRQPDRRQ